MKPHYFRFPNTAVMQATLQAAALWGGPTRDTYHTNLDVIGEAWFNDAVFDAQGKLVSPATKRPGVYCNLMWHNPPNDDVPPPMKAFEIFPTGSEVFRVFAGWDFAALL